ncbi:MAG: anaerobic sulfatase maturase [Spirochaetes bacterium]|nr:anaerobic sulfatase maturase [Spirochaetota bacterium]
MNPFKPPMAFHIMTKPAGAKCNLACKYCFYLEKEAYYPGARDFRMSDETLREYVRQYIAAQEVDEIHFAWQGGEPTLLGVGFFEKAVALQKEFCPPGKTVANAFQTNGVLLDDRWGEFLAREKFLVGISIDGPEAIHDHFRVNKGGEPTFAKVFAGMQVLKKHGVEFNTLTVVNRENSLRALEVYRFLREHGSGFIQFIPIVERAGGAGPGEGSGEAREIEKRKTGAAARVSDWEAKRELLASPPNIAPSMARQSGRMASSHPVTPWSVLPGDYGQFLCDIWDEWVRKDVGKVFVQFFDVQLGLWVGQPSSVCVFAETCGKALAMEHNGDLYSCDHFVYPEYRLGNLHQESLGDMVSGAFQTRFGRDKQETLPAYCRRCEYKFACNGECPKHRFLKTPDGEDGLNYLCAAYKKFFGHAGEHLKLMAELLGRREAPAGIMEILAAREARVESSGSWKQVGRNEPCPCGSGKKYKQCHGKGGASAG